jgi:proline racemase/trans-L-3-hydroxyproline dehydratase
MGEPTRIVLGGLGRIQGKTMMEKRRFVTDNLDHLRTALMHEPRGHRDMFGAMIVDPTDPAADLGIIFMDGSGYISMCGHGVIGAVTVVLEMGMIDAVEPFTKVTLDTPAGLVHATAAVDNHTIKSVTFQNVPSFLYREGFPFELPDGGSISLDIAFGGNFFALVSASDVGFEIVPENAPKFVDLGINILQSLKGVIEVSHPTNEYIKSVDLVEFCGPPHADGADAKNIVVFGQGQIDRSPCGTGTCAKMAALFAKGELGLGQEFVHESIIGTTFVGKLVREEMLGERAAVIPEITGQAFITGIQQFVLDPDDPLQYGFLV